MGLEQQPKMVVEPPERKASVNGNSLAPSAEIFPGATIALRKEPINVLPPYFLTVPDGPRIAFRKKGKYYKVLDLLIHPTVPNGGLSEQDIGNLYPELYQKDARPTVKTIIAFWRRILKDYGFTIRSVGFKTGVGQTNGTWMLIKEVENNAQNPNVSQQPTIVFNTRSLSTGNHLVPAETQQKIRTDRVTIPQELINVLADNNTFLNLLKDLEIYDIHITRAILRTIVKGNLNFKKKQTIFNSDEFLGLFSEDWDYSTRLDKVKKGVGRSTKVLNRFGLDIKTVTKTEVKDGNTRDFYLHVLKEQEKPVKKPIANGKTNEIRKISVLPEAEKHQQIAEIEANLAETVIDQLRHPLETANRSPFELLQKVAPEGTSLESLRGIWTKSELVEYIIECVMRTAKKVWNTENLALLSKKERQFLKELTSLTKAEYDMKRIVRVLRLLFSIPTPTPATETRAN